MMATATKVYFLPNWDGSNSALVAASNQKEACELIGCSRGSFRNYGGQSLDADHPYSSIALSEPGRVWKRAISWAGEPKPWLYARTKREKTL